MNELPAVGQVFERYLPITQNWIYEQLKFLRCVRPVILARRCSVPEEFRFAAMYSVLNHALPLAWWNRFMYRASGHYPLLASAARSERVLLLHAHFGPVGVESLDLARALGVPLITSFYGFDLCRHRGRPERLRARYRALFAHGAAFIVEGPAAQQHLLELGCPAERIRIHRIGVDLCRFPLGDRARRATDRVRVLMVGRFTEKKGLIHGLSAFAQIAVAHPHMHLTIIGDASRGRSEQAIKHALYDLVKKQRLGARVTFTGTVAPAQFRAHLHEHDLLLQPSLRAHDGDCEGGLPVIILEAAAAGLPTIGSHHGDIPQVVRNSETGWLVPERDVEALADALQDAATNPELRERFGTNARRLIELHHDARSQTLDSMYREFLPRRFTMSLTEREEAVQRRG